MTTVQQRPVRLTYADYLAFPDDGRRHELLGGSHVVSPAPSNRHQLVVKRLFVQLHELVEVRGLGEVMLSPSDVVLSDEDVVQPDLYVMLGKNVLRLREARTFGPPDLAIEVLSPSTARVDRGVKKERLQVYGVREYWLVDPRRKVLEQFVLDGMRYRLLGKHREAVVLQIAPTVTVDLGKVWVGSPLPRRRGRR